MAGYSVQEILAPEVILKTISKLALPGTSLQKLFGWSVGTVGDQAGDTVSGSSDSNPTGNVDDHDLRDGAYDTFDNTRTVASGRVPGQPSHLINPQKVGKVRFTIPRVAEGLTLVDEEIHNRRVVGGNLSNIDRGGARYIARQELYMGQRVANAIEFQTAAMLRGIYYFSQNGDVLHQTFASGLGTQQYAIDYQLPATHLDQLDGLVSATWATATTDIPSDIFNINARSVEDSGYPIEHAIVSSTVWNHVVNNTKVHEQGGSANVVFETLSRKSAGEFTARLRSIPWLEWHIVDYGLEIWDGTSNVFERLIPVDSCIFIPTPMSSWTSYIRGAEFVTEGPNGTRDLRRGFYPYAYPEHNPSGWRLECVMNGFPGLYIPKALYHGTVVF